jgi:hypothetical protein
VSWSQWIGVGVSAVQVVLLAVSLYFTRETVRDAHMGHRDEAARFGRRRESERRRLQASAEKERQAEREARLRALVDAIADYEELRSDAQSGNQSAELRAGARKVRLQTALIATGRELEHSTAYIAACNPWPPLHLIDPALEEIQRSLRIYATAAHLPFEGETG